MAFSIRTIVRPVLNQVRQMNKLSFLEKQIVKRTQGKKSTSFWARLIPPLESYSRGSVRLVRRKGICYELDISDYIEYIIYFGLDVEPKEVLYNAVKDGMNVFDIGTNMGETLLSFAQLNPAGKNFGFEPVPFTYQKAKRNIALNSFKNIYLNNLALSDSEGTLYFEVPQNRNFGSISMSSSQTSASQPVKAMSLDAFIAKENIEKVDFIKMDVEGFEANVLRGAEQTIRKFKPLLFIEVVDSYLKKAGSSAGQLMQMVSDMGYEIYDADDLSVVQLEAALAKKHLDIFCKPR